MKVEFSPFNGGKYHLDHEVTVAELRKSGARWLVNPFTGLSRPSKAIEIDPLGYLLSASQPTQVFDAISAKNKADYDAQIDALKWDKDALENQIKALESEVAQLRGIVRATFSALTSPVP